MSSDLPQKLPSELASNHRKWLGTYKIREYLNMPSTEKVVDGIGIYGMGEKWWVYEEKSTDLRTALSQVSNTFDYMKKKGLNVVNITIVIDRIKSPYKKRFKCRKIPKEMIDSEDGPKYHNFDQKKHKFLWDNDQSKFIRYNNGPFIRMIVGR